MILSMTGFANTTVEIPLSSDKEKMTLAISIKSLNSRYFEMSCKVPSLLTNLEVPLQRVLKKQLHRGHVSLHIKIVNSESLNETITPSFLTIQNYLDAAQSIKDKFELKDQVTLAQILQLPNALQNQETQLNETIENAIIDAVHDVAVALTQAQEKEGIQLSHDIKDQLTSMKKNITDIQAASVKLIQEKKDTLSDIMTKLLSFENAEEETKSTEQAILEIKKSNLMHEIEKVDINEETVRFNSHLINIAQQFETQEPLKGKKLDFTIQELNREINTIASKCNNITISNLAINIKSELEKAREQAQNIV